MNFNGETKKRKNTKNISDLLAKNCARHLTSYEKKFQLFKHSRPSSAVTSLVIYVTFSSAVI